MPRDAFTESSPTATATSSHRDKSLGRFLNNIKTAFGGPSGGTHPSNRRLTRGSANDASFVSGGGSTERGAGSVSPNMSSKQLDGSTRSTPPTAYTKTPRSSKTAGTSRSSRSRLRANSEEDSNDGSRRNTPSKLSAGPSNRSRRESRADTVGREEIQSLVRDTLKAAGSAAETGVKFSWRVARAFVLLKTQPAESFAICGIPFPAWPRTKIPTLGASPASCRVQEMYNVTLPGVGERGKDVKMFVKIVPIQMWRQQWEAENQWNGEFATDGENFVMEAAALAFLHEYAPGVAPKLLGILEMSGGPSHSGGDSRSRGPRNIRRKDDSVTHMVVVSELYGEDLLDYLDRRDRKNKPLNEEEKRGLQVGCILLMRRLHRLGLAHLDFTPENILLGPDGLRLCDFAKATPLWSSRLRHVVPPEAARSSGASIFPFESCEPTVGKGAYMPPECWRIYWKLEAQKILRPLEDLGPLRSPDERVPYYFRVSSADVYMLGVVLFWIWAEGGVWKCSDPRQDEKYYHLMRSGMNFDLFRECRSWPSYLKECLAKTLQAEPWKRATMDEIIDDPWCGEFPEDDESNYLSVYCNDALLECLRKR